MMYGNYIPGRLESSRIYGLAGEAVLNFGPVSVPIVFIPFGFLVGRVRRWQRSLEPGDARLLLVPLFVNLCFVVLTCDSDNSLFFLIKNGAIPWLVIMVGSTRVGVPDALPGST